MLITSQDVDNKNHFGGGKELFRAGESIVRNIPAPNNERGNEVISHNNGQ